MLRNLGIVQACCQAGGSVAELTRKLGGKSVLEWVVRRVTDCQQLDGVIVLCAEASEHRVLRELVPGDVPVLVSPAKDPLARFAAATEEFPTHAVIRVRANLPFVDPELIDRLVATSESHDDCDYVGYRSRDGRPAILSPVGMYAEWFRVTALRRANRKAAAPDDRQEVTRYLYSHPEEFQLRLIPVPGRMDRDDVRLRVDMPEDWEHALTIVDALGPEEMDWHRIANLLDHQPALRRRMAALNRDHAES